MAVCWAGQGECGGIQFWVDERLFLGVGLASSAEVEGNRGLSLRVLVGIAFHGLSAWQWARYARSHLHFCAAARAIFSSGGSFWVVAGHWCLSGPLSGGFFFLKGEVQKKWDLLIKII